MEKVEIKGVEILNQVEKGQVNKLLEKYIERIKRTINNDFYLKISLKEYGSNPEKIDKRKKFSISAELSGQIPRIDASAIEWDLNKAMHIVFTKLLEEIEHKFHISDK